MQIGDPIPLFYQLTDYSTGQFVRAFVVNAAGATVAGSPANLTSADSSGLYKNTGLVMPNTPWVHAKYAVYTDGTYTVLSSGEGGGDQTIYLDSGGGGTTVLPPASNIVGQIESDGCSFFPIQDTITQGSDRTLTVRLIQDDSGDPFDLTGYTLISFRFRNADGSVLVLSSTDIGSPVQVLSATGGKMLCLLTSDQTMLLNTQTPSPFSIVVTQPAGITVCNLPTQLSVQQQDV